MSKFMVGDRPWVIHIGQEQVSQLCPVCFGKCVVTLILGNGDSVELPCDNCARGYESPTGRVTEYVFSSGARQETIVQVETKQSPDSVEVEYRTVDHYCYKEDEVFYSEEDALALCAKKCAKAEEEQRTRAEYIKHNVNKKYSWNAGYHLREAKREEESAARHREKAKLCKAKAKEEIL